MTRLAEPQPSQIRRPFTQYVETKPDDKKPTDKKRDKDPETKPGTPAADGKSAVDRISTREAPI
jgi:hypothetical protein